MCTSCQTPARDHSPRRRLFGRTSRRIAFSVAVLGAVAAVATMQTDRSAFATAPTTNATPDEAPSIVLYCGRSEKLVGPIIERFEAETGIDIEVKYGKTGSLAALISREGDRSPATIFYAQDPGGLGVLSKAKRLAPLPESILERVPKEARAEDGRWVGITGRARTMCYSPLRVGPDQRPASIFDLTKPEWKGRVGWAPRNASFQSFVTAMRIEHGDERTKTWLTDMLANDVREYPKNTPIVQAVGDGEIDLGLVNHYYMHRIRKERGQSFPVAQFAPRGENGTGDVGGVLMVSGIGLLADEDRDEAQTAAAHCFIIWLLSDATQKRFALETFEYPLVKGIPTSLEVPPLSSLGAKPIPVTKLDDLEGTIALLNETGILE